MSSARLQAVFALVFTLQAVSGMRQEAADQTVGNMDADWGERHAGSYCCYHVVKRSRFTATSKGYVNDDDIQDCTVVTDRACPVEGDRFEKTESGEDANFLDQGKLLNALIERTDDRFEKDKLVRAKGALSAWVDAHIVAYQEGLIKKIDDEFNANVAERTNDAEATFQEEKAKLEDKYKTETAALEDEHEKKLQQQIADLQKQLDSKMGEATASGAQGLKDAQAELDEARKHFDDKTAAATAASATAIKDAYAEHEAAAAEATATAATDLNNAIQGEEDKLQTGTAAANDERATSLEQITAEETEKKTEAEAPILDLVTTTTDSWSVSSDITDKHDERASGCGEGNPEHCCCLGTLNTDLRKYQAFKVPQNYAFSTCEKTAPYKGGILGMGGCGYFRHCNSCIKKLCNDEKHCGSAPL